MSWLDLALPRSRQYEQLRLVAYLCPAGVWTIGYGATGHGIGPGLVWTEEHAEANLRARFIELGARIDALVRVPLEAHEMAALALFADNVGIEAFRKSTLLRLLNNGDRAGAANQFLRWNKANGRVLRGLTIRRAAERALFVGANA